MKQCTKCLIEKEVSEFGKHSITKDGLRHQCKACNKKYFQDNSERIKQYQKENAARILEYHKQWRGSLKDGYHHVYILPIEHYAGITDCIPLRMNVHKHAGNNTDNHYIVGSYANREDARAHESRLHVEGYNGRDAFNAYK
jgi:hypothetical protein